MTRNSLAVFVFLMAAAVTPAQIVNPRSDVLGPHLNYGRGCNSCHTPHSAAAGSGRTRSADAPTGSVALWGEDVTGDYAKTIRAAREGDEDLGRKSAVTPDVAGLVACLSCHDGNYASRAMMNDRIYETLPAKYGVYNPVPTLMTEGGRTAADLLSNHPVGLAAAMHCGGDSWDCTESEGVVTMKGNRSSQFVRDYGFFVKPADYNNAAVVMCTTCHQPHVRNEFAVGPGSRSGLPPGYYATTFFLRGPYNPASANRQSDQTSQFCRQCHGAQSNEMYGAMVATVF